MQDALDYMEDIVGLMEENKHISSFVSYSIAVCVLF